MLFAETENPLSTLLLFKQTLKFIGVCITQTLYKDKDQEKLRFIKVKCDLYLLRLLSRPTTVYDTIKKLGYAHSTAYYALQQYLGYGIIENVKSERLPSGLTKRYFKLSNIGLSLLEVVESISENCENRKKRTGPSSGF